MRTRWYQRPDTNLPRSRSPRNWRLPIAIALVLLVILSYRWWLAGLAHVLWVDQPPMQADAILVLGGGDGSRQDRAIALYRQGWAPLIISSGEKPFLPDFERSFAELGADYMVARGIPREHILLIPATTSTYDEAIASLALARERSFVSLIIVTEHYHSGRSSLTFHHVYRGTNIRLTFVSAYPAWFDGEAWWTNERSLLAVCEEYEKLIYYLLKGYLL